MGKLGRPPVEKVTVACACCGKSFTKYPSLVKNNKTGRFFCSLVCRNMVGSKPRTITERACEVCGVMFRPLQRAAPGRFCSKVCQGTWQGRNKVERTCENCGQTFTKAPSYQKFSAARFCSKACEGLGRIARKVEGREHNGKPVIVHNSGYLMVWSPGHPKAQNRGWVFEHRLLVEEVTGRYLRSDEQVHHINGDTTDNRLSNLRLISPEAHTLITTSERGMRMAADQEHMRKLEAELAEYRRRYDPPPDGLIA